MADFRRQPEWQQQADRHSTLIDPVLTVRPISRFDYTARRPVTAIDHALVFATAGGTYDVYVPPHRPTRKDAATRRYVSVYEVDMGSHPVRLEVELPSDDDAFSFGAAVDLTWRVSDPEAFVRSGERDVPARLAREFQQIARPASRKFAIEDSPAAEAAVQQAVDGSVFAAGTGLDVTCMVRLRLDDEAVAHRRRQRSLRYESEMLDPEHAFRMRQVQQQYELQMLWQRQQYQLMAEKIRFYQYHLQYGGVGAWALHLAAHPEDTQLVINNIHQDQLAFIRTQLELISGDELEDYQKAESLKQIRREIDDLIRRRSTVPGAQGALPAGAPQPAGAHGGPHGAAVPEAYTGQAPEASGAPQPGVPQPGTAGPQDVPGPQPGVTPPVPPPDAFGTPTAAPSYGAGTPVPPPPPYAPGRMPPATPAMPCSGVPGAFPGAAPAPPSDRGASPAAPAPSVPPGPVPAVPPARPAPAPSHAPGDVPAPPAGDVRTDEPPRAQDTAQERAQADGHRHGQDNGDGDPT
ncbi:hypothetical protein [Streptomyces thermoalcalitolerans]|uniref:PE-PGRS family protein n=1 Tax=Streptomyces thermoalcalitolerans TaxID=65605 RepID=A0ABN1NW24_9ACTN